MLFLFFQQQNWKVVDDDDDGRWWDWNYNGVFFKKETALEQLKLLFQNNLKSIFIYHESY